MHAGKALIDPERIFERVRLAPGMRVADLGCGRTGHFIFSAAKRVGESGLVFAVDIIPDIVESLRRQARVAGVTNIQVLWSNLELVGATPIPASTLDCCFLVNVLFLVSDRRAILAEAKRLLKLNGRLVVVEWERQLGTLGPTPERLVPPEPAAALATSLGFKLVERFPAGDYHYGLVLERVSL